MTRRRAVPSRGASSSSKCQSAIVIVMSLNADVGDWLRAEGPSYRQRPRRRPPVLLGLAFHRGGLGIFHLEPIGRSTGAIARAPRPIGGRSAGEGRHGAMKPAGRLERLWLAGTVCLGPVAHSLSDGTAVGSYCPRSSDSWRFTTRGPRIARSSALPLASIHPIDRSLSELANLAT